MGSDIIGVWGAVKQLMRAYISGFGSDIIGVWGVILLSRERVSEPKHLCVGKAHGRTSEIHHLHYILSRDWARFGVWFGPNLEAVGARFGKCWIRARFGKMWFEV